MILVDSHIHLWNLDRLSYPWLEEVPAINKTFDLSTFHGQTSELTFEDSFSQELLKPEIEKMVFMQCECLPTEYLDEINYVTELAAADCRIQAIVSWFPLEREDAADRLEELLENPLIKGIRRLEETPTSLYSNPAFIKNLSLLSKYQLTFDICAKNDLLGPAITMVDRQPDLKFMLDHMGKPDIKNKEMQSWKSNIYLLAQNPNVYCKVSGLVTEANLHTWQASDLRPYFDHALEQFGVERLVFGSDWPVLTLASSYPEWLATVMELCKGFSNEDLHKLFYSNACNFYRLAESARIKA